MKSFLFVLFTLISINSFSQEQEKYCTIDDLKKALNPVERKISELQADYQILKATEATLKTKLAYYQDSLTELAESLNEQRNQLGIAKTDLDAKIVFSSNNSEAKIGAVNEILSRNTLYGIIGVLSAILLSGLLYWFLSKRQQTDKTDLIDQLSKTKSSIEESLVKEFGKQTELMDSQLHLIEQQKTTLQATANAEPDHSLALKVASEINLIERNINLMDSKTKGLKQLQASVRKLKDNLSANGYEMPELLGKQFHQGMKVIVTSSIPDENLENGSEVISKILIPQVNYNDKMIQTAQIEVSVGY